MAAFYEYIKGYMSDGETTQYIFFNRDLGEDKKPFKDYRPYFSNVSNPLDEKDPSDTSLDFKHYLVSEDGNHTFTGTNTFGVEGNSDKKTTSFFTAVNFGGETNFNIAPNFNKGATITDFINIAYKDETSNAKDADKRFIIKKGETTLVTFDDNMVTFAKALSSQVSVTAPFFNASSDRRLKTNISAVEDSVLPLIVSTPVYTFKYKKHPTIPVIGIMAQDVLDKNINDFNLVKKSSGGYYEIKESKMIYILWKAVQEQQKQIEALQARLEGEVNGEVNN